MAVLPLLILFSLIVAGFFLGAFFWALRNGQFDDLFTPAMRILFNSKQKSKKKVNSGGRPN